MKTPSPLSKGPKSPFYDHEDIVNDDEEDDENDFPFDLLPLPAQEAVADALPFHVARLVCRRWNWLRFPRKLLIQRTGRGQQMLQSTKLIKDTKKLELVSCQRLPLAALQSFLPHFTLQSLTLAGLGTKIAVNLDFLLPNLPSLTKLKISVSPLTDAGIRQLLGHALPKHRVHLKTLSLVAVSGTLASLSMISPFTGLKRLDFSHNMNASLTQTADRATMSLAALRPLAQLEYLGIVGSTLNQAAANTVASLTSLRSLRISKFAADRLVHCLLRLPRLNDLQLGGLRSAKGYSLLQQLTGLQSLSLWWHGNFEQQQEQQQQQPDDDELAATDLHSTSSVDNDDDDDDNDDTTTTTSNRVRIRLTRRQQMQCVERTLASLCKLEKLTLAPGLFTFHQLPKLNWTDNRLRTLSLNGIRVGPDDSFAHLHSLEKLTLYYCPLDDSLFEPLRTLNRDTFQCLRIWGGQNMQQTYYDQLQQTVGEKVQIRFDSH